MGKGLTGIASNPIPLKYALNSAGIQVGNPRLPLVPPDQIAANQIDELLRGYEIDLAVLAH